MKDRKTIYLTQAALIAAIYVVLTLAFAPISFGEIQVRIAEALTILPAFTPAAIPGLFLGCIIGNAFAPSISIFDIVFGSLATLIGAVLARWISKKNIYFAPIPTIIANALIIPFIIKYAYGVNIPIWILMLSVGMGEVASAGVLGIVLAKGLEKHKDKIFK